MKLSISPGFQQTDIPCSPVSGGALQKYIYTILNIHTADLIWHGHPASLEPSHVAGHEAPPRHHPGRNAPQLNRFRCSWGVLETIGWPQEHQQFFQENIYDNRRKFRSQTSDNMDRWKAEMKRTHLVKWEMKSCTLLWREARFQVKMYKTRQVVSTFWTLRCRKSARRCGAKHISKSKCTKHTRFGPLLEVEMSEKCTPLWREAHFEVKSGKNWGVRSTLVCSGKTCAFCGVSKTMAGVVARCISRGRRSTRDMFIRGQGADFLRGIAF